MKPRSVMTKAGPVTMTTTAKWKKRACQKAARQAAKKELRNKETDR